MFQREQRTRQDPVEETGAIKEKIGTVTHQQRFGSAIYRPLYSLHKEDIE
jgi:hypothetical protein